MALLAVRLAETESLLNSYLPAEGDDVPMIATKQMQEMQISFNLQYLQLQSQMQQDSRSYTAVSNIMKTKHDTVKNSISNVRWYKFSRQGFCGPDFFLLFWRNKK